MKIRSILGALVIAALPFTSVWAENMTPEDIQKLVDEAVTKRLQEHERREGATERREGSVGPAAEPGIGALPEVGRERRSRVATGFVVRLIRFRTVSVRQAVRVRAESYRRWLC